MALSVTVVTPAGMLEPDDALIFTVEPDGTPDTLSATVTFADGSTDLAWDYDQTTAGYTGSLEVGAGVRTYTIRRTLGWPLGALSLTVEASATGAGETLLHDTGVLPTVQHVLPEASDPTVCDYVLPGIPFNTFGTGPLAISINADMKGIPNAFPVVVALGTPGFTTIGACPVQTAFMDVAPGFLTGSYANYDLIEQFGSVTKIPFTGTGTALSVYFHAPRTFSNGFAGSFYDVKNIRVLVYSEGGGTETDSATTGWTVGPTAPIEGAMDVAAAARARVIIQYRNRPKLLHTIDVHSSIMQQAENALVQMEQLDDLDIADGVNLDVTADLVGQKRSFGDGNIATDGQLRVLTAARITRNRAHATNPDLVEALATMFGVVVTILDHGGMSLTFQIAREPTADEIAVLDHDILARPMGVKVSRQHYSAGYFGLEEDPDALGLSDDSGGYPGTGGGNLIIDF